MTNLTRRSILKSLILLPVMKSVAAEDAKPSSEDIRSIERRLYKDHKIIIRNNVFRYVPGAPKPVCLPKKKSRTS